MSAADKIAEARKVRRFKLVSEDGWHGMTVRPDGGYVSHKDYAALTDLADAQAQEVARLRGALERIASAAEHFSQPSHSDDTLRYAHESTRNLARAALGDAP